LSLTRVPTPTSSPHNKATSFVEKMVRGDRSNVSKNSPFVGLLFIFELEVIIKVTSNPYFKIFRHEKQWLNREDGEEFFHDVKLRYALTAISLG